MDTRQSTPDVLGSIMSGTNTPESTQKGADYSAKKEKVTFNLPVALLRQLEEVWMQTRKASTKKISKTSIVEAALQQAFSELETQKEKSLFYANLVK